MVRTASSDALSDISHTKAPILLRTEQAAEYLSVSARTVKQLMSAGRLPYVKIGRSTRLDITDLDHFVAQNRQHRRRPAR